MFQKVALLLSFIILIVSLFLIAYNGIFLTTVVLLLGSVLNTITSYLNYRNNTQKLTSNDKRL